MTCSTRRPKGSMPVLGSQRPKILARCTSQAARYCRAPPRSYSCSTRVSRPAAGARVWWQRTRAWIEVFSSAEITKSRLPNRFPSHSRAYRSRTRPALVAKLGSRGKIQERWRQGRMASSDSQRQMVVPEMSATMPRAATSVAMSGMCRRDSGTPSRDGNSQARALTATTTSGGKDRGSTAPGALLQAGQALLEEALAPLRHDLAAGVQPQRDLVVVVAIGGHEHDLGPHHISIRQRIPTGSRFELPALLG